VAVPPASGDTAGVTSRTDDQPPPATTFRFLLLGFLVLVVLLGAGTSIWLLSARGSEALGVQGGASETQVERDAVMSQTRQFMLRMGTYGPDQLEDGRLPEYRELVTDVITPKFGTSFEESVATAEQLVAQAGVSREAEVFSTGVVTLDSDSATTLVAGTFTDTYRTAKGGEQEQRPVPFRIEVDLVKTDDEWLVDDFTPVTGAEK
jgi:Mce-associated membrane protein